MRSGLKVAVLGTGYWAQFQIAAWQDIGAEVCCVWNRTESKAQATAKRFHIEKCFSRAEDVFKYGGFDIVDIITDPSSHEELVNMAVAYRKPVICQKPMADSLLACERMVKRCKDANIWFAVHENFRFQPQFILLKKLMHETKIGKIRRAELWLRSPDRDIIAAQPALLAMENMAYLDMGPHIFDVARYLFGEVREIASEAVNTYADLSENLVDEAYSDLRFESGLTAKCNLIHKSEYKAFVQGEDGTLTLRWDNSINVCTKTEEKKVVPHIPDVSYIPLRDRELHGRHVFAAIPLCLRMLADCYMRGAEADTSGEDNLKTLKVVYAAIQAAKSGKTLQIN